LTPEILGKNAQDFDSFPMLVKLIDAKQNLSVQVHPSDDYALAREHSYGKTEMWYIVEADESAGIYLGFSKEVTKDEVRSAIANNTLCDLLKFYPVKAGEAYFIPSGTVHAIGAGCLICEIQQNSNLTYRVYDYGRVGHDGKPRELHIDKALDVMSFTRYRKRRLPKGLMGLSKYFTVRKISVSGTSQLKTDRATFKGITVVSGRGFINSYSLSLGDSVLVGADESNVTLSGEMEILVYEVRKYHLKTCDDVCGITATLVDDLDQSILSVTAYDAESARKNLLNALYLTDNDVI
jgi:mannose-6-phosphate isomerase